MNLFRSILACWLFIIPFHVSGETNFKCNIFRVVGGGYAKGSLALSGSNFNQQSYELFISDSENTEPKKFEGTLYLKGQVNFTSLQMETQEDIISTMKMSRRPGLSTGPLLLFSNTKSASHISTINAYLMPSGEIGYIEVGALPVLCM